MEYKLLEEQDLELMLDFVDDENTKYNVDVLKKFIDNKTGAMPHFSCRILQNPLPHG